MSGTAYDPQATAGRRRRRDRRADDRDHVGAVGTAWMVTFTDLVLLLLTFFVMLFSMSTLQPESWEVFRSALSTTLRPADSGTEAGSEARYSADMVDPPAAESLRYLARVMEEGVGAGSALTGASVRLAGDRVVLSLPDSLLFNSGSAELTPAARAAVYELGGLVAGIPNRIAVSGHTDPAPVGAASAFASNWELSLARAGAVASALSAASGRMDVAVRGHADSRFADVADLPEDRRAAAARRVDVVILAEGRAP